MATGWFGGDLDTTTKAPVTGWWAEISRNIQPVGRTITLTGGQPDVRVAKSAVPTGGLITITGGQPVIRITQNVVVTPTGGVITLTGSHPALGTTVRPNGGVISLTGGQPVVRLSDHQVFTPVGGAITLTGGQPTVSVTAHVYPTPTGGPILLTGGQPVVTATDHKTVTPSGGVINLTGGQPTASVGIIVTPNPGTIALTGGQPTVATPVVVTPTGRTITLIGSAPALGTTIRPVGGTIALTGGQPVVGISDNKVFTPTGQPLALTGGQPVVTTTNNQTFIPSAATIGLTGGQPVIAVTDHKLVVPTGQPLTLTGGQPVVTASNNKVVQPSGGTITLTGGTPTVTVATLGFTDDFNRANGNLGADWDDDTTTVGSSGSSPYSIVSNYLAADTSGAETRYKKTPGGVNIGISMVIKGTFGQAGGVGDGDSLACYLRVANQALGYLGPIFITPDTYGGAILTVYSAAFTIAAQGYVSSLTNGDVVAVEVYGKTVTVYVNGKVITGNYDSGYYAGSGDEYSSILVGNTGGSTFLGLDSFTIYASTDPGLRPIPKTLFLSGGQPGVWISPSIIGNANAQTTSVAIPTHAIGDLILVSAGRAAATGLSKPAASGTVPAWVTIDAPAGTNTRQGITAYFVATATNHTTGTWTGAGSIAVMVLRGQGSTPIGGHGLSTNASSTSSTAPAITLAQSDGSSRIVTFHHSYNGPPYFSTAPTGWTRQTASPAGSLAIANSKDVTTSDGSIVQTLGTAGLNIAAQIEIRAH